MHYTIKQENSKGVFIELVKPGNADDAIRILFKAFATQQKINRRFFGISKTHKTYLCYNEQPIHSAPFILSKHTLQSSVTHIMDTLLPEFESVRTDLEPLLSM